MRYSEQPRWSALSSRSYSVVVAASDDGGPVVTPVPRRESGRAEVGMPLADSGRSSPARVGKVP